MKRPRNNTLIGKSNDYYQSINYNNNKKWCFSSRNFLRCLNQSASCSSHNRLPWCRYRCALSWSPWKNVKKTRTVRPFKMISSTSCQRMCSQCTISTSVSFMAWNKSQPSSWWYGVRTQKLRSLKARTKSARQCSTMKRTTPRSLLLMRKRRR